MPAQSSRPKKRRSVTKASRPDPVIFRLDEHQYERLQTRANDEGMKTNAFARDLVLEAIAPESEGANLSERLAGVEGAMNELRESMSFAVEGLLLAVTSGKSMSPGEVKEWVRSVFKLP